MTLRARILNNANLAWNIQSMMVLTILAVVMTATLQLTPSSDILKNLKGRKDFGKVTEHFFKKRLLQKSERSFLNTKISGWILQGTFWSFFGTFFSYKKKTRKSHPKSTAEFKSEFGNFAAKIYTTRIWPWHFCKLWNWNQNFSGQFSSAEVSP